MCYEYEGTTLSTVSGSSIVDGQGTYWVIQTLQYQVPKKIVGMVNDSSIGNVSKSVCIVTKGHDTN